MLAATVACESFISQASPVAKGMSVRGGANHDELLADDLMTEQGSRVSAARSVWIDARRLSRNSISIPNGI
jgi:hypothetical protein